MSEPFYLKKALDISPNALGKSTSSVSKGLLVLGIIALCGWAIYVTYIKPHTKFAAKTQTQAITIQKGASATIVQKTDSPKKWLFLFIEPFIEQRQHSSMQTGIRVGIRLEF